MRKHIARCEINSIILTFDKFITNAHKKKITFSQSKYTRQCKFEYQMLFER